MELIINLDDSKKYKFQNVYMITSLPTLFPSYFNNDFPYEFNYVLDKTDIRLLMEKYLSKETFFRIKDYIHKQESKLQKLHLKKFNIPLKIISGFGYDTFFLLKDLDNDKQYIQSGSYRLFEDKAILNVEIFNESIY